MPVPYDILTTVINVLVLALLTTSIVIWRKRRAVQRAEVEAARQIVATKKVDRRQ